MKNRILSLMLAALLALSLFACAFAEETSTEETTTEEVVTEEVVVESAINLYDSSLTVGGKTYTFPISVAEITEMGVTLPDVTGLSEGQYYYSVAANDGRNGFALRVAYVTTTEDPYWVTGVTLNSENHAGMVVGGLVLGETTMEEVVTACGAGSGNKTYEDDSLTYYRFNSNIIWILGFESASKDAKLTSISMHNEIVSKYGDVDASLAGVQDENLPEPTALRFDEVILDGKLYQKGDTLQKLLDNGWVLPEGTEADAVIAVGSGFTVNGDRCYLYNGEALIKVGAFNTSDADCTFAECVIDSISASYLQNASLVCADSIQPGVSTIDDAKATFGEPQSTNEQDDGTTNYTFTVINDVDYTINANADGTINVITVEGLM